MSLIEDLRSLSTDLWWTTQPRAHALWPALDPDLWEAVNHNRRRSLMSCRMLLCASLVPAATGLVEDWKKMQASPARSDHPSIAYFCMEYGLHESLPIYSVDSECWQATTSARQATWASTSSRSACSGMRATSGRWSTTACRWPPTRPTACRDSRSPCPGRRRQPGARSAVRVWSHPGRSMARDHRSSVLVPPRYGHRWQPPRASGTDPSSVRRRERQRILQEVVLGIGGLRMLRALDIDPGVFHMNEGHAAS